MAEWIEINLPFANPMRFDDKNCPPYPDTSEEERRLFGVTCEEAFDKADFGTIEKINREIEDEINIQQRVEIEEMTEEVFLVLEDLKSEEQQEIEYRARQDLRRRMTQERLFRDHPEIALADAKRVKIEDWRNAHPLLNEWHRQCVEINEGNRLQTFSGQGLSQPGVQIELEDVAGTAKRYLIGDINPLRGVCDDCTKFESDAIIKRYRVLITPEMLQGEL